MWLHSNFVFNNMYVKYDGMKVNQNKEVKYWIMELLFFMLSYLCWASPSQ